jgi:hypothetical protein
MTAKKNWLHGLLCVASVAACDDSHTKGAEPEPLEQSSFSFPGDAEPNDNNAIGPFCCTGQTVTVNHKDGYAVGYVYYFNSHGQAFIGPTEDSTIYPNLEIEVAALEDAANPDSPMIEGNVVIHPAGHSEERVYEVAVGQLVYSFTLHGAKLWPEGEAPEGFLFDAAKPTLDMDVHVLEPGEPVALAEPLAYGTHSVHDGDTLQFADQRLNVGFAAQSVTLASGDHELTRVAEGVTRFAPLDASSDDPMNEPGITAEVRKLDGDSAWISVDSYLPTQRGLAPGPINLDAGDFLVTDGGFFQLLSTRADGTVEGRFVSDQGEPQDIQGKAGSVLELPGVDSSRFSPLEVYGGYIHFDFADDTDAASP